MALVAAHRTQKSGTGKALDGPRFARASVRVSILSWIALAAFTVLGAVLYGCTLGYPFHFDAQPYVIQNPLIRDFLGFRSYFDFPAITGRFVSTRCRRTWPRILSCGRHLT